MASLLAGGDCIDDVDALRKGTEIVLSTTVLAPSTIGTFLRGAGRPDPANPGRWRGT